MSSIREPARPGGAPPPGVRLRRSAQPRRGGHRPPPCAALRPGRRGRDGWGPPKRRGRRARPRPPDPRCGRALRHRRRGAPPSVRPRQGIRRRSRGPARSAARAREPRSTRWLRPARSRPGATIPHGGSRARRPTCPRRAEPSSLRRPIRRRARRGLPSDPAGRNRAAARAPWRSGRRRRGGRGGRSAREAEASRVGDEDGDAFAKRRRVAGSEAGEAVDLARGLVSPGHDPAGKLSARIDAIACL